MFGKIKYTLNIHLTLFYSTVNASAHNSNCMNGNFVRFMSSFKLSKKKKCSDKKTQFKHFFHDFQEIFPFFFHLIDDKFAFENANQIN